MVAEYDAREGAATATSGKQLTRGEFLYSAASVGVGGLLGLMIGVPVAGMALSPAVLPSKFTAVKLGDLADFTKGAFVKVVLEPDPTSPDAYVKKRVAFVRLNEDGFVDRLAAKGQGKYSVISNRCAHLGCPVQEGGGTFVCPCHGGAYDTYGSRTAGPPVRPLDRFQWEERGSELWAIDEYSVRAVHDDGKLVRGEKVKVRGPGQHSGGLEGLFYPLQP